MLHPRFVGKVGAILEEVACSRTACIQVRSGVVSPVEFALLQQYPTKGSRLGENGDVVIMRGRRYKILRLVLEPPRMVPHADDTLPTTARHPACSLS